MQSRSLLPHLSNGFHCALHRCKPTSSSSVVSQTYHTSRFFSLDFLRWRQQSMNVCVMKASFWLQSDLHCNGFKIDISVRYTTVRFGRCQSGLLMIMMRLVICFEDVHLDGITSRGSRSSMRWMHFYEELSLWMGFLLSIRHVDCCARAGILWIYYRSISGGDFKVGWLNKLNPPFCLTYFFVESNHVRKPFCVINNLRKILQVCSIIRDLK